MVFGSQQNGFYYESGVIVIFAIFLVLILNKSLKKKNRLTTLLFFNFLMQFFAIISSWLSKLLNLYTNVDTEINPNYFVRIIDTFRLSLFFMAISIYIIYLFKIGAFDQQPEKKSKNFILFAGIFTALFQLVVIVPGYEFILTPVAFLFLVIFLCIVYIPYMRDSFAFMKAVDNPDSKRGFLYLGLSSIAYVLIFVSFLIDQVLVAFADMGFTFFYFAAWTFGIISIALAVFGYIRPGK